MWGSGFQSSVLFKELLTFLKISDNASAVFMYSGLCACAPVSVRDTEYICVCIFCGCAQAFFDVYWLANLHTKLSRKISFFFLRYYTRHGRSSYKHDTNYVYFFVSLSVIYWECFGSITVVLLPQLVCQGSFLNTHFVALYEIA